MIVTKSWLNEFVDLDGISNEKLYETFNSIGLEVDRMSSYEIPKKVVVGKIISCEKHPDADKLNVCQIDVGLGIRQIVCGAANVVDARYVAVATLGAVLPGDLEIKYAKLRGVASEGMVCSAVELGLPEVGKGILILDESIGTLEVGRELGSCEKVADTVIELELTANRGDCLSIYGVARDLSVALERKLKPLEYQSSSKEKLGIARMVEIQAKGEINADLSYMLASVDGVSLSCLVALRLAMTEIKTSEPLAGLLQYSMHAVGVTMRAYDAENLKDDGKIHLNVESKQKGIVAVIAKGEAVSFAGISQDVALQAKAEHSLVLFETSYINPDLLVEAVAQSALERDEIYYRTSRGSEPQLYMGAQYLSSLLKSNADCTFYDGSMDISSHFEPVTIGLSSEEVSSIIGQRIEKSKIVTILASLGFEIHSSKNENFSVVVPRFRHDVKNIQDVTEEIVRIIGINNIAAQPMSLVESNQKTEAAVRYAYKKELRQRASAAALYENISYIFSDRSRLEANGFACVEEELDLVNPITEELNTIRSTMMINLLEAVKRNVSYTKKSIGLFEIGAVFDAKRRQKEMFAVIFCGQKESENVANSGKPAMIDFASFVGKIGSIIGTFELAPCSYKNRLIHPYQSADILINGQKCGYLSKLHPVVQNEYGIYETFFSEIDWDALLPEHINAKAVSNFQGVYRDLSIVIDKQISYGQVNKVITALELEILKEWYPVDVYEDISLGGQKSLTVRFMIQSMHKTLEESEIESVMMLILNSLEHNCQAKLR